MSKRIYAHLNIAGPVSVERVERIEELAGTLANSNAFLILGPTGAGKSTFIEVLAPNGPLQISSNQLDGFTQSISTYRIVNVERQSEPVYLVDLPGFADTKISVMSIVSMLKEWLKVTRLSNFCRVLYFTPINNPRLPGSHRQVLRTFDALTGVAAGQSITLITTMWNTIWGDNATNRAERNFEQLRDGVWKEFVTNRSWIGKFYNTQESTLSILDSAFDNGIALPKYHFEQVTDTLREASYAEHIREDLQSRIQSLQNQLVNLNSDLEEAEERQDVQLRMLLLSRLDDTKKLLIKFSQQLREFESDSLDLPTETLDSPIEVEPTNTILLSQETVDVAPHNSNQNTPTKRGVVTSALKLVKNWGKKRRVDHL
ncbi:hypothetical protein BJ165DRAFT_1511648 [Panaeolus papilionaceus]|nr:hypothetical protein BJ165DRAFT_1511648 [Panaeolus papilionaceus]